MTSIAELHAGIYRREHWEGPLAEVLLELRECAAQQNMLQVGPPRPGMGVLLLSPRPNAAELLGWVLPATEGKAALLYAANLSMSPFVGLLHSFSKALGRLLSAAGEDCILIRGSLPGAADGCPATSSHCPSGDR